MNVQVKFFASLREHLNLDEVEVSAEDPATVMQIWQLATHQADMPNNVLMAVNMHYVDASEPVTDGDEVAFFPPVTGG